jgi:hypothetical protein
MSTEVRLARTPDGRRLECRREVRAPAETVWDLFVDTRHWPAWGPSVAAVELDDPETGPRIAAGTTGRVRVAGVWVPFTVTSCVDRRWTWSVARVPATGHRVESLAADRCRAVFEVPVVAAAYVPICGRALRRLDRLATDGC